MKKTHNVIDVAQQNSNANCWITLCSFIEMREFHEGEGLSNLRIALLYLLGDGVASSAQE